LPQLNQPLALEQLRHLIDEVDQQLHELLNKRASLANQVAQRKLLDANESTHSHTAHSHTVSQNAVFYRPEREAEVLRAVMQRNKGPLADEEVARLFREIMSACLALEQPLQVAYLGPEGTFTQAATIKHFGDSITGKAMPSIDQVFHEVEVASSHYGVVPIENSTEGVVSHTLDLFLSSPVKIIGEVSLRIHQNLMSNATEHSQIKTIYSHQQSLAQCRLWLDEHYTLVDKVAVKSNAEAARLAQLEPSVAAIAGEIAASLYQLPILAKNIEDNDDNTTRFLILGKQEVEKSHFFQLVNNDCEKVENKKADKTSLLVSSENKAGALFQLLQPIAQNNISMSRIESRPSKCGVWQYVFFIDIEGHMSDPVINSAIEAIKQNASMVKVLGSYPQAAL